MLSSISFVMSSLQFILWYMLQHLFCVTICVICVHVCPQVLNLSKLPVYYGIKISCRKLQIMKFFLCCVFYLKKIYPKHVLPFVGIVLAETQQRRDIGMLITESTIECSSFCDQVNLPWTIRDTSRVFDTCVVQVSLAPAL